MGCVELGEEEEEEEDFAAGDEKEGVLGWSPSSVMDSNSSNKVAALVNSPMRSAFFDCSNKC